jgi:CHASE2 domain-containing sensor protein
MIKTIIVAKKVLRRLLGALILISLASGLISWIGRTPFIDVFLIAILSIGIVSIIAFLFLFAIWLLEY